MARLDPTARMRHAIAWRMQAILGRLDAVGAELATVRRLLDEQALPRLGALGAASGEQGARLEALELGLGRLDTRVEEELLPLLRILAAEEGQNQRRLQALRDSPEYEAPWSDPDPLVSITIATRDRPELLASRALPSLLAQTHDHLEVVVVGDAAGPDDPARVLHDLDDVGRERPGAGHEHTHVGPGWLPCENPGKVPAGDADEGSSRPAPIDQSPAIPMCETPMVGGHTRPNR